MGGEWEGRLKREVKSPTLPLLSANDCQSSQFSHSDRRERLEQRRHAVVNGRKIMLFLTKTGWGFSATRARIGGGGAESATQYIAGYIVNGSVSPAAKLRDVAQYGNLL